MKSGDSIWVCGSVFGSNDETVTVGFPQDPRIYAFHRSLTRPGRPGPPAPTPDVEELAARIYAARVSSRDENRGSPSDSIARDCLYLAEQFLEEAARRREAKP